MTTLTGHDLLTIDEAQSRFAGTAITLVEAVACRPERLAHLLASTGTTRGLPAAAACAVRAHRAALRHVRPVGLSWLIDHQIDDARSYAGLDDEDAGARAA